VYTASPRSGQTYPLYNDQHTIWIEMELFGCEMSDLNKGNSNYTLCQLNQIRWQYYTSETSVVAVKTIY
jgi:hypothetical protein